VLTRTRVVGLVRELADMGIAVVYSTHLLDELADLGDPDVVFLRDGDVVSQGSVSGLVARLGLKTRIEVDYGGGDATHGARRETIEADQPDAVLEALLGRAREAGESITRIQTFGPSASTVFHALHEMAADDAR
jgi:ABC-type multidrug transport system ATPase subunit